MTPTSRRSCGARLNRRSQSQSSIQLAMLADHKVSHTAKLTVTTVMPSSR